MNKSHYSLIIKSISILTLVIFAFTQTAWGYSDHIRAQAAGESKATGEIAAALGREARFVFAAGAANGKANKNEEDLNLRPPLIDRTLSGHGTNGYTLLQSVRYTNRQLRPAGELPYAPLTGESIGASELNQNFVSAVVLNTLSSDLFDVYEYALHSTVNIVTLENVNPRIKECRKRIIEYEKKDYPEYIRAMAKRKLNILLQAREELIELDRRGLYDEEYLKLSKIPICIVGDGMVQGLVFSDIPNEVVFRRLNIRIVGVIGRENISIIEDMLDREGIDDIIVMEYDELRRLVEEHADIAGDLTKDGISKLVEMIKNKKRALVAGAARANGRKPLASLGLTAGEAAAKGMGEQIDVEKLLDEGIEHMRHWSPTIKYPHPSLAGATDFDGGMLNDVCAVLAGTKPAALFQPAFFKVNGKQLLPWDITNEERPMREKIIAEIMQRIRERADRAGLIVKECPVFGEANEYDYVIGQPKVVENIRRLMAHAIRTGHIDESFHLWLGRLLGYPEGAIFLYIKGMRYYDPYTGEPINAASAFAAGARAAAIGSAFAQAAVMQGQQFDTAIQALAIGDKEAVRRSVRTRTALVVASSAGEAEAIVSALGEMGFEANNIGIEIITWELTEEEINSRRNRADVVIIKASASGKIILTGINIDIQTFAASIGNQELKDAISECL